MDDGIELPHVSRQLEAGDLSPPGAAVTSPTGIRQSEMRPGDDTDNRLNATKCAYDTLDEGFFRLVRITQAPSTGRIECWTEQFSLQDPPPYTALSYACGPRPANFNLKLNGRDWNVRQNLAHFLRQHVEMDQSLQEWMWIDAICINQTNLPERTHQVKLMADIYGKASRVLVWLGPAYEDSNVVMRGLLEDHDMEQPLTAVLWLFASETGYDRSRHARPIQEVFGFGPGMFSGTYRTSPLSQIRRLLHQPCKVKQWAFVRTIMFSTTRRRELYALQYDPARVHQLAQLIRVIFPCSRSCTRALCVLTLVVSSGVFFGLRSWLSFNLLLLCISPLIFYS